MAGRARARRVRGGRGGGRGGCGGYGGGGYGAVAASQTKTYEEEEMNTLLRNIGEHAQTDSAGIETGGTDEPSRGGSDPSLVWVWVSLFVAFCAMAVGYWGWGYMKEELLEASETLLDYTFCWRLLPIALILASLVVATTAASAILKNLGDEKETNPLAATDDDLQAEGERGQHERISLLALAADGEATDHDVRTWRPDVTKLIREAVTETAECDAAQRLVVAACGPAELTEAVRNAVGNIRKEGCRVALCFSGTDSRW